MGKRPITTFYFRLGLASQIVSYVHKCVTLDGHAFLLLLIIQVDRFFWNFVSSTRYVGNLESAERTGAGKME